MSTRIYTVEKVSSLSYEFMDFVDQIDNEINEIFGGLYDLKNFDVLKYLMRGRVVVAKRKNQIIGLVAMRLVPSLWDVERTLCVLDLIYSKYPKGAYLLLHEVIDYGTKEADDIVMYLGPQANIKAKSLKKLGFRPGQDQYVLRGLDG